MTTEQTQELHEQSLVWHAHTCSPLKTNADLRELRRSGDLFRLQLQRTAKPCPEYLGWIEGYPEIFPPDKTKDYLAFVEPEQFPKFTELLYKKGYSEQAIRGVLGGNFTRVTKEVWK